MIAKEDFGRTGHASTRVIFGSYALSQATQQEADQVLGLLLERGVNHIDTARMYGDAEKRIGPWMEKHRDDFFVATKTRKRTYHGAWNDLRRSLHLLRVDHIDLWQMHGLTYAAGWERAMGPSGALEAMIEARDKGLVRFLGVTGHGIKAPAMHLRSLERFDFESVLLPCNFALMQNPRYAADFEALAAVCRQRHVALQIIKAVARRPWTDHARPYHTHFYEPLDAQDAVDRAVHWAFGWPNAFVISAGDMRILRKVLDAAARFAGRPSDTEMAADAARFGTQPIFV